MEHVVEKKRFVYLDVARVAVAFLVIYGHLYTYDPANYVRVFIYQFHMAFFFFVSGMLHKYNGTIQIKKYLKTIGCSMLFYMFVYFLITGLAYYCGLLSYKESIAHHIVSGSLIGTYWAYCRFSISGIVHGIYMLDGPCWFLVVLVYCRLYMDLLNRQKKIFAILWGVIFVLFCLLKLKYMFVGQFAMVMPFYFAGFMLKEKVHLLLSGVKKYFIAIGSVFAILGVIFLNGSVSVFDVNFCSLFLPISVPLFYLGGFLGCIMVLSVARFFEKERSFGRLCANSLISILGFQALFIFCIDNYIGYNLGYGLSFVIFLGIFAACVVVHLFISNYGLFVQGRS